jgi:hypothetical protein
LPRRREANMNRYAIAKFFTRKRKIILLTLLVYAAML